MRDEDFPYYDDSIVFSENLPQYLKERLDELKAAWQEKNLINFIYCADCLEPLFKNSYFLHQISKKELEKFFVMLGRDWWNRSERVRQEEAIRKSRYLACFPKDDDNAGNE